MFIEHVKAKDFGRLAYFEQNYADGIIVVRGPNGSGKTTSTVQIPLYCWFGASTLDAPIADTVNEDAKPKSLYTEVKYGPYVTKRTKTSASVVGPGIEISGQVEVSNFWYNYLGIAKGAEEAVLLSKQGDTAGILKGKNGEITSTIETMAGFDQIDALLTRLKDKFPSGNKLIFEENIQANEEKLQELSTVELPDLNSLEKEVEIIGNELRGDSEAVHKAKEVRKTADAELKKAVEHNYKISLAKNNLQQKEKELQGIRDRIVEIDSEKWQVFDLNQIEAARNILATVEERRKAWEAWTWLQSLQEQAEVWEGDIESFKEELSLTADNVNKLVKEISSLKADIRVKKTLIVTDKTCKLCKQDVTHLHKEMNKKTEAEIINLEQSLKEKEESLVEQQECLQALNNINNEQIRREKKAKPQYHLAETNIVPYTYSWVGEAPLQPEEDEISKASELIAQYQSTERAIKKAQENRANLAIEEAGKMKEVTESVVKITELGTETELEPLNKALENAEMKLESAISTEKATQERLNLREKDVIQAKNEITNNANAIKNCREELTNLKKKLKTDIYNGKLVDAVRKAKPAVMNRIWNGVAKMVSQKSSDMLGREMIVEKGSKGFRVNGRHVGRLSGAEASVTGIALREAIRDTFSQNVGCIFLDEPMASMDTAVKSATIAAISSIRGQVFVVSHEEESISFADQVVEHVR